MNLTVKNKNEAIVAIRRLQNEFHITENDLSGAYRTKEVVTNVKELCPITDELLRQFLGHLNTTNIGLAIKYDKLTDTQLNELILRGANLINEAYPNNIKMCYYGNDELALYCVMRAVNFFGVSEEFLTVM